MTHDPNYRGLFEWAINALHQNLTIKRAGFSFGVRLVGDHFERVDNGDRYSFTTADLLARDWGVA